MFCHWSNATDTATDTATSRVSKASLPCVQLNHMRKSLAALHASPRAPKRARSNCQTVWIWGVGWNQSRSYSLPLIVGQINAFIHKLHAKYKHIHHQRGANIYTIEWSMSFTKLQLVHFTRNNSTARCFQGLASGLQSICGRPVRVSHEEIASLRVAVLRHFHRTMSHASLV